MKLTTLKAQILVLILSLLLLVPPALATTKSHPLPPVPSEGIAAITARELRMHLSFLASQELGGRYTFSSGNRIAARYLASQLESFGYHGGAKDGSFFQPIEFISKRCDASASYLSTGDLQGVTQHYLFNKDFSTNDVQALDVTTRLVFVGYGISAPERGYDDYAGLNVKGKVVIVCDGKPKTLKSVPESLQGLTAAQAHGASAIIVLPYIDDAKSWQSVSLEDDDDSLQMTGDLLSAPTPNDNRISRIDISPKLAKTLLETIKVDWVELIARSEQGETIKPQELPLSVHLTIKLAKSQYEAQNVVAIYEGSSPQLKQEYLMLSAHYDHLKSSNDNIYCGADDDGSGVASVLTIAHALASGVKPQRSILVVFHTGEELGLYGSRYFTRIQPLVPLTSIITDLNVDMIGRSRAANDTLAADRELTDSHSLYVVGSDKHSSELKHISEQTNQELTGLRLDYTYDNENHPSRLYYRSDHYNYAIYGIPIIFYFTGLHSDYHRPSDTIEKIDFEKMTNIARLIYATSWRLANLEKHLTLDHYKSPNK